MKSKFQEILQAIDRLRSDIANHKQPPSAQLIPVSAEQSFTALKNTYMLTRSSVCTLSPFPCIVGDACDFFTFTGLPNVFQDFLRDPLNRVCSQCRVRRPPMTTKYGVDQLFLCLLCGLYVCSNMAKHGTVGLTTAPNNKNSATCYFSHIGKCDGRIGIYLHLKRGDIILISHSSGGTGVCFWPSLYTDKYGEPDLNLQRGRPLFLNEQRCKALAHLYLSMGIPDYLQSRAVPELNPIGPMGNRNPIPLVPNNAPNLLRQQHGPVEADVRAVRALMKER